ncbi:MAG: AAA family ATPase [Muribaculaceae bacterium]|nr:AAA family ATPase [Muribaculaceae bacterium]
MLTKFAVKNYRGFADKIELDLSHPSNYEFNTFAISNGVIKNGIIYGPNGSGKSNLGLAIFDIEYHLAPLKAKKSSYYDNYEFGNSGQPVEFEYTFNFNGQIVEYKYLKDKTNVLHRESLWVDDELVFSNDKNVFEIKSKYFPNAETLEDLMKNNANNISIINLLLAYTPLPEDHFLIQILQFVNNMLWIRYVEGNEFIGIETQANTYIEEFIIKNSLVTDFADFLSRVSGQKFHFRTPLETDKGLFYIAGDKSIPFYLTVSSGTKSLELLYFWIKRMGNPSFVFIDEFDAFYHYKLAYNICQELFRLPCQLFMSSHNTYLMNNELLRPDCNFIISDNVIKPLNECTDKELRFGHNIEKLYRGKAFSL